MPGTGTPAKLVSVPTQRDGILQTGERMLCHRCTTRVALGWLCFSIAVTVINLLLLLIIWLLFS